MSTHPATNFSVAVDNTILSSDQLYRIINGHADEMVYTDSGDIPTIRKALVDNFFFLDPLPWVQGGTPATVFNQLYLFTDGTAWYAPQASVANPIDFTVTPLGDPSWKMYATLAGGENGGGNGGVAGLTRFNQLTDAPSTYTGQGDLLRINATNDGLEFFTNNFVLRTETIARADHAVDSDNATNAGTAQVSLTLVDSYRQQIINDARAGMGQGDFLSLDDTPTVYGNAGDLAVVNGGANGLEFIDPPFIRTGTVVPNATHATTSDTATRSTNSDLADALAPAARTSIISDAQSGVMLSNVSQTTELIDMPNTLGDVGSLVRVNSARNAYETFVPTYLIATDNIATSTLSASTTSVAEPERQNIIDTAIAGVTIPNAAPELTGGDVNKNYVLTGDGATWVEEKQVNLNEVKITPISSVGAGTGNEQSYAGASENFYGLGVNLEGSTSFSGVTIEALNASDVATDIKATSQFLDRMFDPELESATWLPVATDTFKLRVSLSNASSTTHLRLLGLTTAYTMDMVRSVTFRFFNSSGTQISTDIPAVYNGVGVYHTGMDSQFSNCKTAQVEIELEQDGNLTGNFRISSLFGKTINRRNDMYHLRMDQGGTIRADLRTQGRLDFFPPTGAVVDGNGVAETLYVSADMKADFRANNVTFRGMNVVVDNNTGIAGETFTVNRPSNFNNLLTSAQGLTSTGTTRVSGTNTYFDGNLVHFEEGTTARFKDVTEFTARTVSFNPTAKIDPATGEAYTYNQIYISPRVTMQLHSDDLNMTGQDIVVTNNTDAFAPDGVSPNPNRFEVQREAVFIRGVDVTGTSTFNNLTNFGSTVNFTGGQTTFSGTNVDFEGTDLDIKNDRVSFTSELIEINPHATLPNNRIYVGGGVAMNIDSDDVNLNGHSVTIASHPQVDGVDANFTISRQMNVNNGMYATGTCRYIDTVQADGGINATGTSVFGGFSVSLNTATTTINGTTLDITTTGQTNFNSHVFYAPTSTVRFESSLVAIDTDTQVQNSGDFICDNASGIVLTSADGTQYRLAVSDAGVLSTQLVTISLIP